MNKKWIILFGIMLSLLLVVAACGEENKKSSELSNEPVATEPSDSEEQNSEETGEEREIEVAHMFSENHQVHLALVEGEEWMQEQSDGRLSFYIHPNGSYGEQFNSIEEVRMGTLDVMSASLEADYYPPAGALFAPYAFRDYDHWEKFKESDVAQDLIEKNAAEMGVVQAGIHTFGFRSVVTNGIEGRTPDDFEGSTIRTVDVVPYNEVGRVLNATGTPIPIGDVYMSLKTGVVDATENPLSQIYEESFHEVAEYLIMTEHMLAHGSFVLSEDMMNSLSDTDRQIVLDTFDLIGDRIDELTRETEDEYKEMLEEEGLTVIYPDKEQFKERAQIVIDDYPEWEEVYNSIITLE